MNGANVQLQPAKTGRQMDSKHTTPDKNSRSDLDSATEVQVAQSDGSPAFNEVPVEIGGPPGLEPTRYGDWEKKGRCIDF
jgi:hypothetical protein